eukprot:358095-Amorphochlora_amoeboformis.AAC.1
MCIRDSTKSYRELKTLEERIDESSRIRAKYPDRVPVICERCNKSRSLAALEKVLNYISSASGDRGDGGEGWGGKGGVGSLLTLSVACEE